MGFELGIPISLSLLFSKTITSTSVGKGTVISAEPDGKGDIPDEKKLALERRKDIFNPIKCQPHELCKSREDFGLV